MFKSNDFKVLRMKNILIVLNIVLLLAVAFLYMKVFSGDKKEAAKAETPAISTDVLKIAYINTDTLLEKYDNFKKERDALQKKEKDADASLKAKGRSLEKDLAAIQAKIQQGLLSPGEIQKEEQRFGQRQQALMQEQEQVTRALLEEGQRINEKLQKSLIDELKSLKDKEGYDFILSYAAGGQILVADSTLDITQKVLSTLNAKPSDPSKQ